MKRLNRKKIIEVLETARQGYSTLVVDAIKMNDKIMEISCKAHHISLNEMIVELGGDGYDPPFNDEKSDKAFEVSYTDKNDNEGKIVVYVNNVDDIEPYFEKIYPHLILYDIGEYKK